MAKHKHREQQPLDNDVGSNTGNNGNPFGIDPAQLMGMLGGNFDINNLLSSMNIDGLNLNNLAPLANMAGLNLGNLGNMGNFNKGNKNNVNNMGNMGNSNNMSNNNNMSNSNNMGNMNNVGNVSNNNNRKLNHNENTDDSNLQMLISLRGFVHPNKINFIDKMIELYKSGTFKNI